MRFTISTFSALLALLAVCQSACGQISPGYSPLPYDDVGPGIPVDHSHSSYPDAVEFHSAISSPPVAPSYPVMDAGFGLPTLFDVHRTNLFADFLFLAPRELDVAFATHVDGPVENAAPLASPTVVAPNYDQGIRFGLGHTFSDCFRVSATGWLYVNSWTESLTLPANTGWIRSEVTHPSTASIFNDSLTARAREDVEFLMGDLELEWLVHRSFSRAFTFNLGVRYAEIEQDFQGNYLIDGPTTVDSEISYHGVGPRVGLEAVTLVKRGVTVYGEAFADILFGDIDAAYRQQNAGAGTQFSVASGDEFRVVPQLEAELGIGWQNCDGSIIVRAGYFAGFWFNMARMPSWIRSAQRDGSSATHETIIFDGLTARAEIRF